MRMVMPPCQQAATQRESLSAHAETGSKGSGPQIEGSNLPRQGLISFIRRQLGATERQFAAVLAILLKACFGTKRSSVKVSVQGGACSAMRRPQFLMNWE